MYEGYGQSRARFYTGEYPAPHLIWHEIRYEVWLEKLPRIASFVQVRPCTQRVLGVYFYFWCISLNHLSRVASGYDIVFYFALSSEGVGHLTLVVAVLDYWLVI